MLLTMRAARHRVLTTLMVAVMSALITAQTLPQGVRQGPSMAGITEYAFPNGLRVLLLARLRQQHDHRQRHRTSSARATKAYGESGMAHLLEHLLFIKSTNDRNIKKELEDRGARWNGTTWYDRTNYYETVNASDENLRWALGLEAERMVNMRIEKALLDTGDDRCSQRVRARRKQRRRACWKSASSRPRTSGTTTASPRSARAPTSSGCRSTVLPLSTASTTSPTTPW